MYDGAAGGCKLSDGGLGVGESAVVTVDVERAGCDGSSCCEEGNDADEDEDEDEGDDEGDDEGEEEEERLVCEW